MSNVDAKSNVKLIVPYISFNYLNGRFTESGMSSSNERTLWRRNLHNTYAKFDIMKKDSGRVRYLRAGAVITSCAMGGRGYLHRCGGRRSESRPCDVQCEDLSSKSLYNHYSGLSVHIRSLHLELHFVSFPRRQFPGGKQCIYSRSRATREVGT